MRNASRAQHAVIAHFVHHALLPKTFPIDMRAHFLCHHPRPRCLTQHYHPSPLLVFLLATLPLMVL